MKIKYVTLTGSDDQTKIAQLLKTTERFPFVEWGILFSQSKSGIPRYPGYDWVEDLLKVRHLNLSAHLCGKWVRDILMFGVIDPFFYDFQRIQVNLYRQNLSEAFKSSNFWNAVKNCPRPVILGGNYHGLQFDCQKFLEHDAYVLLDASGGNGVLPDSWPKINFPHHRLVGYAGGLGPANVIAQLCKIEKVANDECWIDMESNLRNSKNEFDFDKCWAVLTQVENWTQT